MAHRRRDLLRLLGLGATSLLGSSVATPGGPRPMSIAAPPPAPGVDATAALPTVFRPPPTSTPPRPTATSLPTATPLPTPTPTLVPTPVAPPALAAAVD